jgi:hypothetical protein
MTHDAKTIEALNAIAEAIISMMAMLDHATDATHAEADPFGSLPPDVQRILLGHPAFKGLAR